MDDHQEEHLDEESDFLAASSSIRPRIFEGSLTPGASEDFDAITIHLDGGVQGDLKWKTQRDEALAAIDQGFSVMWNVDLGLFDRLPQPLANQGQFLSLALSLEHFRDSLWSEFKDQTVGVSIYRGAADFSIGFPWDFNQEKNLKEWLKENSGIELDDPLELRQSEEGKQLISLFCRDVAVEYLALLAGRLPDTLTTYLFLDGATLERSPLHLLQGLNPDRFERFHLALRNVPLPFDAIGWGAPTFRGYSGNMPHKLPISPDVQVGVCIPPMQCYQTNHYEGFEEGLALLQKSHLPFKLIAESRLTSQWDGLDYLLFSPAGLSIEGKRKLQGFCAAGGTVVSTAALIGLPQELNLSDFSIELRKMI